MIWQVYRLMICSAVFLISAGAALSTEDLVSEESPSIVRAVRGEVLRIPCVYGEDFDNLNDLFKLWRLSDDNLLYPNGLALPSYDIFGVDYDENTLYWWKSGATDADAGPYSCIVRSSQTGQVYTRDINVSIVEPSNDLNWSSTFQCGPRNHKADGTPYECDHLGAFPCCSPEGECGFRENSCDCNGCTDYRQIYE